MEIIGYLASVLIGISLGMLGGGGSILTVPVLVYFFGVAPVVATTYSLFIVGISSLAGSMNYYKRKMVDFRVLLAFGFPSVITIFLTRRYVLPAIPVEISLTDTLVIGKSHLLMITLAAFMVFAAISMIKQKKGDAANTPIVDFNARLKMLLPLGVCIGFITGILGAGCGFMIIPALVLSVRLPMKNAIGTSLAIISLNSLSGFLFSHNYFMIDWTLFSVISGIAILGIFIGSRIAVQHSDTSLKKSFAVFVLAVAAWIFTRELLIR